MTEPIESVGLALGLCGKTRAGLGAILLAFERGDIITSPAIAPPTTGVDILEAAADPSPQWWVAYAEESLAGLRAPLDWALWLYTDVTAPQNALGEMMANALETDRAYFNQRRVGGRSPTAWSDLEALGWLASGDQGFVSNVRAFAHQPPELRDSAREAGLRYLHHHIACSYCQCAATKPLRPLGADGACTCLSGAFDRLTALARAGDLVGVQMDGNGTREIAKGEYLGGSFTHTGSMITAHLIGTPTAVLFDALAVKAMPRANVDSKKCWPREKVEAWINTSPYTARNDARKAFLRERGTKGLSDWFDGIWQEVKANKVGRPNVKKTPK